MNIRVSTEWLAQYGVESIPLADGSGVVAQLGVYHELHCLVIDMHGETHEYAWY